MSASANPIASPVEGGFSVMVHGMIELAECIDSTVLYCRSTVVKGRDWHYQEGTGGERANVFEVVTQMSERLPGPVPKFSFNAPFDFALSSTNVYGWPQIAFGLATLDSAMRDTTIAYARCHVPMRPGMTTLDLPLLQPVYSTPQHKLFGTLFGTTPELRDLSFLCTSDDRIVMTARRVPGFLRVSFDVAMSGLTALGYE